MKIDDLFNVYSNTAIRFEQDPTHINQFLLDQACNDLFTDVLDYTRRVACKICLYDWIDSHQHDIAADSTLNIWLALPTFKAECRFSSWVYRIARNKTLDFAKQIARRREISYLDCRVYHSSYAGVRCGAEGTGPEGETDTSSFGRHLSGSPVADSVSNNNDGHGRQELFPQSELHRDTPIITAIDLEMLRNALTSRDRTIWMAVEMGTTAADIAAGLGCDIRFVTNRLSKIREMFRDVLKKDQ
jgi:RNA polymerase sigma factor (sigma-70 family)